MDVYWSQYFGREINGKYQLITDYDMLTTNLDVVYNDLKSDENFDKSTNQYLRCPSAVIELSKTYVVKSGVDYDIHYTPEGLVAEKYTQEFFDTFVEINSDKNIFLCQFSVLVSETPCSITTLPPYLHTNSVTRNGMLGFSGTFDISKWFRPIHGAYHNDKQNDISIKKGDALYYIKLNTDEKINLKKFKMTSEILDIMETCVKYKNFNSTKNLSYLYNLFKQKKYNKQIMKEIKNNLVE